MPKRDAYDCDACTKRDLDQKTIAHPVTGWVRDPAGGASEHRVETLTLCPDCAGAELRGLLKKLSMEEAVAWVAAVNAKRSVPRDRFR